MEQRSQRKIYNASFIAYFAILVLCALMRLAIGWLYPYLQAAFPKNYDNWASDIFTVVTQLLILGMIPVLTLWLYGRKGFKGTASYLQIKKPKPYIFFAFVIAIVAYFATLIIADLWDMFLQAVGVGLSGGGGITTFGGFMLSILLIAVFPAVCEEITHRGMVLRALQSTGKSEAFIIVTVGFTFGLFHMSIDQTVYTMALGCVLAFVALKSKAILPAVIIHFTNNLISTCVSYGVGVSPGLNAALSTSAANWIIIILGILAIPGTVVLCYVFLRMARKNGDAPKPAPKQKPAPAPAYYNPYAQYQYYPYPPQNGQNPQNPYAQFNPYAQANQQQPGQNPYAQGQYLPAQPPQNPYAVNAQQPNAPQQVQYPHVQPGQNPYAQYPPPYAYPPYPQPGQNPYAQANPYAQGQNPQQPNNPYAQGQAMPQNPYAPPNPPLQNNPYVTQPPQPNNAPSPADPYAQANAQQPNPYQQQQWQHPPQYAPQNPWQYSVQPAAPAMLNPAWETVNNPDKLADPALPTFKARAVDNIFRYVAIFFAAAITIITIFQSL